MRDHFPNELIEQNCGIAFIFMLYVTILMVQRLKDSISSGKVSSASINAPDDDMFNNHSTDLLSFCLPWYGFHDAIREGDGDKERW